MVPAGRDGPSPSPWRSKRGRFRELELGSPSREHARRGPRSRAAIRRQLSGCPRGPTLWGSGAASLDLVTSWPGRATAGERAAPSLCRRRAEGGASAEPACRAHGGGRRPPGQRSPAPAAVPTPRSLAGARLRDTSRTGNLPGGGVLACQGRRRRSPGWQISVEAPSQNPAGPEQRKPHLLP